MNHRERLFDQFPPATAEQWMNKIQEDLKGADFERRMVWRTDEGFDVRPFYRTEDLENIHHSDSLPGEFPYVRGSRTEDNIWLVRQDIRIADYRKANGKARDILMKGVDSVGFVIENPESVNPSNLETLLRDICIDAAELNFVSDGKTVEILEGLAEISQKRGLTSASLRGAIEADPLIHLMLRGRLCVTPEEGFDYLANLTRAAIPYPRLKTIHLNASRFGDAGAGVTLELALALSAGSEYMAQLTERGISAEKAASKIRFSFGTGPDYFACIAGLRAARLLWSVVQKGYIPDGNNISRMEIHCTTGRWNKTIYDPYVNMLRTQTEAMSAVLGGTDSLTVEPFDSVFRKPDDFPERIARNQQLILKEEANFDKVADPAAGSYYIENLTSMIADKAWKIFLELEEQGGFLESLKSGSVQKRLKESAAQRKKAISAKKTILLGTNQFPDIMETITPEPETGILYRSSNDDDCMVEPVRLMRGATEFEEIRIAVDRSSYRPSVFLMTLGNPVMRKARAQFSANFFGCAGYSIINNTGFETIDEGIDRAMKSGADIVVICSSDEEYPLFAPVIFKELRGRAVIVIAGNPSCTDELRKLGIENFIYTGLSMTDTLRRFNEILGIEMSFEQENYEAEIQI